MNLSKNIQTIAKETLRKEAEAINKVIDYIDNEFEKVVQEILLMKGRLVVTGVEKAPSSLIKLSLLLIQQVPRLCSCMQPMLFMEIWV